MILNRLPVNFPDGCHEILRQGITHNNVFQCNSPYKTRIVINFIRQASRVEMVDDPGCFTGSDRGSLKPDLLVPAPGRKQRTQHHPDAWNIAVLRLEASLVQNSFNE